MFNKEKLLLIKRGLIHYENIIQAEIDDLKDDLKYFQENLYRNDLFCEYIKDDEESIEERTKEIDEIKNLFKEVEELIKLQ